MVYQEGDLDILKNVGKTVMVLIGFMAAIIIVSNIVA